MDVRLQERAERGMGLAGALAHSYGPPKCARVSSVYKVINVASPCLTHSRHIQPLQHPSRSPGGAAGTEAVRIRLTASSALPPALDLQADCSSASAGSQLPSASLQELLGSAAGGALATGGRTAVCVRCARVLYDADSGGSAKCNNPTPTHREHYSHLRDSRRQSLPVPWRFCQIRCSNFSHIKHSRCSSQTLTPNLNHQALPKVASQLMTHSEA